MRGAELGIGAVGEMEQQFLPFAGLIARAPAQRRNDGGGDFGRRAVLAQRGVERLAMLEPDEPHRRIDRSPLHVTRRVGDVFGDHAHAQRGKSGGVAGGRIGQRAQGIDAPRARCGLREAAAR